MEGPGDPPGEPGLARGPGGASPEPEDRGGRSPQPEVREERRVALDGDGAARCPECGCSTFVEGAREAVPTVRGYLIMAAERVICVGCSTLLALGAPPVPSTPAG